jgi:microcystin degradation protein MlrC
MHETNTFSRIRTDMALIRRRDFHLENEIPATFRGTRSALGATFEAADKYGWTLVLCGVRGDCRPDPCAPRRGAFQLHGAMVTESHEDAEGELLARLREPGRRPSCSSARSAARFGRQP